jgi:hypothetical protein
VVPGTDYSADPNFDISTNLSRTFDYKESDLSILYDSGTQRLSSHVNLSPVGLINAG